MIFPQLLATASLVGMLHSGVPSRDRETFGLRYRTPTLAGFSAQIGTMMSAENGIVDPTTGAGIRHWAVAAEYRVVSAWRVQMIYGNFDELRAEPTPLPQLTYYRFFAVGNQFTLGQTVLTVEKLLQAPLQTHAGIHDLVVRVNRAWYDLMVTSIHGSYNQPAYHFVTAEATLRPFVRFPPPFRWMGVEGGTRALPSPTADRESVVTFVGAGLFFRFHDP